MLTLTSAQIESAVGFTPAQPTAKYRAVFTFTQPGLELINFTRDNATGQLSLLQAQLDGRPASAAATSTRDVLQVLASTDSTKTTVLRIVNPNSSAGIVSATAYSETGSMVGSGMLGMLGANQILTLSSSQIETLLGYSPASANARYRLVLNANLPSFEILVNVKVIATGNLYLAQAQTEGRAAGSITTTRNAYIIYPSNNALRTTELKIINTTAQSAALTASAYDDSGTVIGTNVAIGTLAANGMLTLTSAQLESLFSHVPSSSTSKWRIVFSANLANFEVINYANEATPGLPVLAQPQTE